MKDKYMSKVFAPIILFTENDNEEIIINSNLKIRKITKEIKFWEFSFSKK
jgi:hypothetical protein